MLVAKNLFLVLVRVCIASIFKAYFKNLLKIHFINLKALWNRYSYIYVSSIDNIYFYISCRTPLNPLIRLSNFETL